MDIRNQIFLELHNKPRTILLKDLDYDFGPLEEISTIDLPFLTIPYLNASLMDRGSKKEEAMALFTEYIQLVEKYFTPIRINTREDKIRIYNLKQSFTFDYIDWEDREWLVRLLEYFYIKSLETLRFLKLEPHSGSSGLSSSGLSSSGLSSSGISSRKIEIRKINSINSTGIEDSTNTKDSKDLSRLVYGDVSFRRSDLLRRRINPKYSLEEFGDLLVERLKKQSVAAQEKVVEEEEQTLKELRERDEERDDQEKGNTKNVG